MKRKTFSSTTTASSITMPTASVSASRVIMLSVKPMYCMAPKVAISELGMAIAEISVGRKRRRKMKTMKAAKIEPAIRCSFTASTAATMNFDWSRTISAFQPAGSCAFSSSNRSLISSTTAIELVPDCLRICSTTAGLPSTLAIDSASSTPSSMRATSPTRTG